MNRMAFVRAGLHHLRRAALAEASRGRSVPLGPPLSVSIGVTRRCTYRCVHCDVWRDPGAELPLETWDRVFAGLARWVGPVQVGIAGGEPFLRKDLREIVRAAASRGLLPSVVTNGAPPIDAADVATWPLVSLTLSIDSLEPGPHDELHRAQGAHARVMGLVQRLCEAGIGPRLRVAAVLTGKNVDQIVPLARWVAERGIGGFTLQPLGEPFGREHDPGWYASSGLAVAPERVASVVSALREGSRRGWPVLNPARQLEALPRYYEDPERPLMPCTVGTTSLGIGEGGTLRFCPYLPSFGHVEDGPLPAQWRGPEAARVREMVRACRRGCSIMNCTFNPTLGERLRRWRGYFPLLARR